MVNTTTIRIVVNSILLSTMFYFISSWKGTKRGMANVKASLNNYLANRTIQHAQIKVV